MSETDEIKIKHNTKYAGLTYEEYKKIRNEKYKEWKEKQPEEKKEKIKEASKKSHKGRCETCEREYNNIHQHLKTEKHRENEKKKKEI
jgi:ABC-type phosphate transport system substrate-binding protein